MFVSPPAPIFEISLRVAARHHLMIQRLFVDGRIYDAFFVSMVGAHYDGSAFDKWNSAMWTNPLANGGMRYQTVSTGTASFRPAFIAAGVGSIAPARVGATSVCGVIGAAMKCEESPPAGTEPLRADGPWRGA